MLKQPTINHRQAGESAVPAQKFATPQDEIRHIQKTDQTLAGFARVLEIVRDGDFSYVRQGNGQLAVDWLTNHSAFCAACVGALAGWFFGDEAIMPPRGNEDEALRCGYYGYRNGQHRLAAHMGMGTNAMRRVVQESLEAVGAVDAYANSNYVRIRESCDGPFCSTDWPADHAEVFRHLADRFPGK